MNENDNDNEFSESASTAEATVSEPPKPESGTSEDWKDRYVRLAAEFDNFRKRSAREFGDLIRGAERDLIAELTEVFDDVVRATGSDHKGESVQQFAQGVSQIGNKFWSVLEKRGLERFPTVGLPFNPEEHDALMRMPSDQHPAGVVMQEIAPGYRLGGKMLRHAKVVVSEGRTS